MSARKGKVEDVAQAGAFALVTKSKMAHQFLKLSLRRWLEYLIAILLGNAIYFWSLVPHLPKSFRHQAFQYDWGLAVDFGVCVAVFGLIRLGERLHRKSPKEELER